MNLASVPGLDRRHKDKPRRRKMSLVCENCTRSFNSQSGLTLHKKSCVPPKAPLPKSNGNSHLTPADRREIQRLIVRRQDTLLKAMGEEIDGRPESIIEKLRADRGVTLSHSQIKELINKIDQQIKDETEPHLEDEKEKLNVKKSDIDEEYAKLEREMRDIHKKAYTALLEKKASEKAKITEEIKAVEQKVIKERAFHLVEQRQKLQTDLVTTEKAEAEVQAVAQTQVVLFKRNKGRIESLIREAANTALEELVGVSDRIEAQELIKRIPSLTEALNILQNRDGLVSFMNRLNPDIKVLAYTPQKADIDAGLKDAAAMVHEEEEDEDDIESAVEDHENEVYEN